MCRCTYYLDGLAKKVIVWGKQGFIKSYNKEVKYDACDDFGMTFLPVCIKVILNDV